MRLFVAVEISEEARQAAGAVAEQLRSELDRSVVARWVPTDDLHLTVRFIGHVADQRVDEVLDALTPALALAPFEVVLGRCGAFPLSGPPRVIWIGLSEGLSALAAMHDEFDRRLAPLGFVSETRPFNAHLTLARVKDAPGPAIRHVLNAAPVPPVRSPVASATLFESRLSPRGSRYRQILRVPLDPAPRA